MTVSLFDIIMLYPACIDLYTNVLKSPSSPKGTSHQINPPQHDINIFGKGNASLPSPGSPSPAPNHEVSWLFYISLRNMP